MDSACCNHMTPHSSLFSELKPAPHPLNICTANGSTMSGHNIGSVSTFNLSVPVVFNVPDLSYNLFSVGQLVELGYHIIFDYSGCIVQDLKTGQELGTGPRVRRMFPVENFRLPLVAPVSVDCVSCRLGKQPALPFNTSELIFTDIFDLIHSDIWGPSSVSSIGESRYIVVFVDDYSRYS